jgi:CRP/FNR family transcriptional regulator
MAIAEACTPDLASFKVACSGCTLRDLCLPVGLGDEDMALVDRRLVAARRKVPRGESLFRHGDPFDAVYAVWTGFFKTRVRSGSWQEHVTGFQMGGELIGLDAIGSGRFPADAVALENSQVCVIRLDALQSLSLDVPLLQQQFHRIMSREIARRQDALLLLGSTPADQRVAAFLLDLTQRLKVRGFSASSVALRMTRRDIGSLLGLTLETVSRTLHRLQAAGLLLVRMRNIHVTDPAGLQRMLERGLA